MAQIVFMILFVFCGIWILLYLHFIRGRRHIPVLHEQDFVQPRRWPSLSIVIPACNEAAGIEEAVQTLCRQDYPDYEIILINDRSSDGTGTIIDRLAQKNNRIRPVHIEALPQDWLGKVHALYQGVRQAKGDWLLFSDADVHFSPGLLRRSISYALRHKLDHLTLIPHLKPMSFWLDVAVRSFGLLFLLSARAARVNQPRSKAYVGIGAFNLVNRALFNKTPGFEWLRMEPADDVGVAMLMKQAGGRSRIALADRDVFISWYPSVSSMFKGMEKNLFGPGCHYQWWRLLLSVGLMWTLVAAPVAAFVFGIQQDAWLLTLAACVVFMLQVLFPFLFARTGIRERISLMLFPAGMLLISAMMLHAGYQCLRHSGIDWRGTHYPLSLLKAGRRVNLGG